MRSWPDDVLASIASKLHINYNYDGTHHIIRTGPTNDRLFGFNTDQEAMAFLVGYTEGAYNKPQNIDFDEIFRT